MYASEAKKWEFLVHLDSFTNYLKYLRNFEKWSKWTKNSNFFASKTYTLHNSLPSFWAKLGYSQIKNDPIADSLLQLQIKIGVHLINVELSQLLTLILTRTEQECYRIFHSLYCTGRGTGWCCAHAAAAAVRRNPVPIIFIPTISRSDSFVAGKKWLLLYNLKDTIFSGHLTVIYVVYRVSCF